MRIGQTHEKLTFAAGDAREIGLPPGRRGAYYSDGGMWCGAAGIAADRSLEER